MGHDVQVRIDKTARDTFTTYDIISGVVELTLTSSISLTNIQVKLEGISTSRTTVTKHTGDNYRTETIEDVHKVLYDSLVVFPPENIRAVSTSKEFTLTPGEYKYPFHFKFPLLNACTEMPEVTNMVLENKKCDILVNNGNSNLATVKNAANNFYQQYSNREIHQVNQHHLHNSMQRQEKHELTVLPPSFEEGYKTEIRYFVKTTCNRLSFFKPNLRAFDPFNFVPLDLDVNGQPLEISSREVFFKEDVVFRDKYPHASTLRNPLPNPPRKGFRLLFGFSSQRSSSHIQAVTVLFWVEVRFAYPMSISPSQPPPLRLYFVSDCIPNRYLDDPELGAVYLQGISMKLSVWTLSSVFERLTKIHQSLKKQKHTVCNNTFHNLPFNLKDARKNESGLYELEIPSKYYTNWELPHLVPSFQTCNITRQYSLKIDVALSSQPISENAKSRERKAKTRHVDLYCSDVRMLSGIKPTRGPPQRSQKQNTLDYGRRPSVSKKPGDEEFPQLPQKPTRLTEGVTQLPLYEDAVRGSFAESSNFQHGFDRKS